jgi:hypothetical protein
MENWRGFLYEQRRPVSLDDPRIIYNSGGIVCYKEQDGSVYCGTSKAPEEAPLDIVPKAPYTQSFDTASFKQVATKKDSKGEVEAVELPTGETITVRSRLGAPIKVSKFERYYHTGENFSYDSPYCKDLWIKGMERHIANWPMAMEHAKKTWKKHHADNPDELIDVMNLLKNESEMKAQLKKMKKEYHYALTRGPGGICEEFGLAVGRTPAIRKGDIHAGSYVARDLCKECFPYDYDAVIKTRHYQKAARNNAIIPYDDVDWTDVFMLGTRL